MNDEQQRSEFEDQARSVGRKTLPPEWRAEILDTALRLAGDAGASWENVVEIVEPEPVMHVGKLEGQIRKAERRAVWSMAACFVLTLLLAALLLRPKFASDEAEHGEASDSIQTVDYSVGASDGGGEFESKRSDAPIVISQISSRRSAPSAPPKVSASSGPVPAREAPAGQVFLNDESERIVVGSVSRQADGKNAHDHGRTHDDGVRESLAQLTETLQGLKAENAELNSELAGNSRNQLQVQTSSGHGDEFRPLKLETSPPPTNVPAHSVTSQSLGQHSDDASWTGTAVTGGVFANEASGDGQISPGRPANPKGRSLSDSSTVGGTASESHTRNTLSREQNEEEARKVIPLASPTKILDALPDEYGVVPGKDAIASHPAPGQSAGAGKSAELNLVFRAPVKTTATTQPAGSNITEEVRYQIDETDDVGDPTPVREIGVTVAVTPRLLPDGSIQMQMRPRSAQPVEEILAPSGNRYSQVSKSMIENVSRIPEGHSLVLGGFYGEVKPKDGPKNPLLGDIPEIGLFLKGEEAANEPADLIFVATPTKTNGKVTVETKILTVNDNVAERVDIDWPDGLAADSTATLNALFGSDASERAAGGGALVLSPEQLDGVLRSLARDGLAKQLSNPTLVTENDELATISLIDHVPIITTTLSENEGREPEKKRPVPKDLEKEASNEPWSTFSLNVSDVSFKLAKAALARGQWPAADQVRVEEFVNAFDYGDPSPRQDQKVACQIEQAAHPFLQQRNILRVSMKTAALGRAANTPLRLTVLLDKSGSMERSDRAASVQNAFQLLADQLHPGDQVTLIGFARTPRLLADRLPGNRVAELAGIVAATPSQGGTNLEQALTLAIEKAKEQMLEGGQNRIILMTDGAANLGNAAPEDLSGLVESMRQQGIAFDACGVGADGLNDDILESLTRKGDGRYYFLDRPEDADAGFAKQIAGALRPTARNVKVQVKFNPNRVGRYKLYGFEKHLLDKEDFRDDSVDAAELAAEEAGNALYHVQVLPEGSGAIGTVSVRFQDTATEQMIEREWTIPYSSRAPRLEDAAPSLRLASGAALLGEKLKGSLVGEAVDMQGLAKLINALPGERPLDERVQNLAQMTSRARELAGE